MNDKNPQAPAIPFDNSLFEIRNGRTSMTVESAEDAISIYGSLDITATKDGLSKVKKLADYLNEVVKHLDLLEQIGKLPDEELIEASVMKDNPFTNH